MISHIVTSSFLYLISPEYLISSIASERSKPMTQAAKISAELLQMNKDALAALVMLGARAGDAMQFITNPTDRFIVARMLVTVR